MTRSSRPKILVTNDDGIGAPGLEALIEALEPLGDIYVVAPEHEMSGSSHSLLFEAPLRYRRIHPRRMALSSTPAACVKFGFAEWFGGEKPALVASGINRGANLGNDINYSGTVAAALEGAFLGVPALAVSMADRQAKTYRGADPYIRSVAESLMTQVLPYGSCVNLNLPSGEPGRIKGIKVARQGKRVYYDVVSKEGGEHEGTARIRILREAGWIREAGTDVEVVADDWISLTPLSLDFTHHELLPEMESRSWHNGHNQNGA